MKNHFISIGLIGLSLFLISWGGTGHYKISTAAGLSFNSDMAQFNSWVSILASHASDADNRKWNDPTEGPKHYIDIDNYNEFNTQGRIPQTLDSVITLHGSSFVYGNGILPWATLAAFDSLESCFERHDWDKAVLFASDLGHYVADGHMPLHITKNYNGYDTGNSGIHSRYESTMINAYVSQVTYEGSDAEEIQDVSQYIFNYLYTNTGFVSAVIDADDYAKSISSNYSSTAYKTALWEKTKDFTIPLFSNASHALAELIYTAWLKAGSPMIITDAVFTREYDNAFRLEEIAPNPIQHSTRIHYTLTQASDIQIQVVSISGQLIEMLDQGHKENGSYTIEWQPTDLPSGVYYVVLKSGQYADIKKVVVAK